MSRKWLLLMGAWLLAVGVRSNAAQGTPDPPMRSTVTGVYTAAQADAGQAIFEASCLGGCHNMASHRGAAFKQHWDGRPISELFEVIQDTMPKDDPGSLTPKDAIQLVAYLMKLNGLPAGKDELPADAAPLKKIKIEIPSGAPRPGASNR